ncbi:MAG: GTP pyrophosphokinase family protein [Oscillospiraceae bacterium]|nr:GTP pyrophosphokinase family protein [Oscillospiraceae bacterium]MBR0211210.1 GTP pyrophosphokinase family protein [Oscillospiraceae bacterium]
MMVEKRGSIHFEEIPMAKNLTAQQKELAKGMVRVNHLYRSALKVAMTQVEILDEEFASLYDHSPIHHIEYRIKTLDSIIDKLRRRGYQVTIDNIYAHIHDVAGIRVICNYLDDIYYLRSLLTRSESFKVLRETDYIKTPKDTGYRSLHLVVEVPIVISEGTLKLPVEIQLRTIAMDMWASLEHELRYKSRRKFSQDDAYRLRLCSDAISEVDREMQNIYQGAGPEYSEKRKKGEKKAE